MNRFSVLLVLFFGHLSFAAGPDASHIFAVGGGVAHPSFTGAGSPVGYLYGGGFTIGLSATGTMGSTATNPPINYRAGFAYGGRTVGGGIWGDGTYTPAAGTTEATNSISPSFGIAGAIDKWGFGVSGGGSGLGTVGIIYDYNGKTKIGFLATPGGQYGLGFGYEGSKLLLAIDVTSSTGQSGTIGAGIGFAGDTFQMVANYVAGFGNGASGTAGTAGLGLGFRLGSNSRLTIEGAPSTTTNVVTLAYYYSF